MPLTPYQEEIARLLAAHRTFDSYLAGGAAIHLEPQSTRYSNDLDYFHDSAERVATAFADDARQLARAGHAVTIEMQLPGYIRATVASDGGSTKVEWAHDSAWRFLPTVRHDVVGFVLHPIDLAVNKLLALAGRDEARDFLDILDLDQRTLRLGALCWAAAGKDPGFTPFALLEILRRRGKYHQDDFGRLKLTTGPVDLPALKARWLTALTEADAFVRRRPPSEAGCLYYSPSQARFVSPDDHAADAVPHYGRPGGVLPQVVEDRR